MASTILFMPLQVTRYNLSDSIVHIREISNIQRTKPKNLNVSRLVVQLSLCNLLKPGVKLKWRCRWSSANRRCSNYIWVINNYIAHYGATYIRGLTVCSLLGPSPRVYHRSVCHTHKQDFVGLCSVQVPDSRKIHVVKFIHISVRNLVWLSLFKHDVLQ